MKAVALALILVLGATPALSGETAPDPAPAETKLDPRDPNTMRCRKISVTGSLVKKERICKTNAEWARLAERGSKDADEIVNNNRGNILSQ